MKNKNQFPCSSIRCGGYSIHFIVVKIEIIGIASEMKGTIYRTYSALKRRYIETYPKLNMIALRTEVSI